MDGALPGDGRAGVTVPWRGVVVEHVLRVDHRLSWAEIAEVVSGEFPVIEATLRKRFERLKARLARLARERGLVT